MLFRKYAGFWECDIFAKNKKEWMESTAGSEKRIGTNVDVAMTSHYGGAISIKIQKD